VKVRGKQFKAGLKTVNLAEARRKLKDFRNNMGRIDPDAEKITVEALADRYLATVQHQARPQFAKRRTSLSGLKINGEFCKPRTSKNHRSWLGWQGRLKMRCAFSQRASDARHQQSLNQQAKSASMKAERVHPHTPTLRRNIPKKESGSGGAYGCFISKHCSG
jgi:hypothetical protein